MARNVAADATEGWRAVLVFSVVDEKGDESVYTEYEGLYNTEGAAKGRITYWKNWTKYKIGREMSQGRFLVKGWVEKTDLNWSPITPE